MTDTDTNERQSTRQVTTSQRPDPVEGRDGERQRSARARSAPRAPWLYRLVRDRSGQSTVVGVALMLAVATIGVTAVVALGGTALSDTQSAADLQRTEHAMTLLDSRGAMAALGESDSQQVRLSGTGRGTYEVSDDSGWIRVEHVNFTDDDDDHEVFNESLGSVRYTAGETVIAYEGGGVWRTQGNRTVMVSPPEFHYRDQTLTMPLVRVVGSGSASGRITADLSPVGDVSEVTRIYPNETENYPILNTPYDNPVKNGTVVVTVKSDHYQGWATYFEERTEGNLTVDHDSQTASIELKTLGGAPGAFDMPLVGDSLEVPSVAQQHNLTEFELTLQPDTSNANAFQQLHWSLYYDGSNGRQFEVHFAGNGRCDNTDSYNDDVVVSVYYRNNTTAPTEEWQSDEIDPNTNSHVSVDCTGDAPILTADLFSALEMTYEDIDIKGTDNKWHYGDVIKANDVPDELTVDQHAADSTHGPYDAGTDSDNLSFVMNHYFSLMGPDFELTVDAGPGNSQNRVDEDASTGVLMYDTIDGEEFIQYLHVTENEVRIRLLG